MVRRVIYDPNGNLVGDKDFECAWDFKNRLRKCATPTPTKSMPSIGKTPTTGASRNLPTTGVTVYFTPAWSRTWKVFQHVREKSQSPSVSNTIARRLRDLPSLLPPHIFMQWLKRFLDQPLVV